MTFNEYHQLWIELEKRLNGKLSICEKIYANTDSVVISVDLEYYFENHLIKVHQGIFEGDKGQITRNQMEISTDVNTHSNFDLNTWRLDFFDKLLNRNRIRTGYRDFDRIIGIKGENKTLIQNFFRNNQIRSLLIKQWNNLQIENADNKLHIQLKVFKKTNQAEIMEKHIRFIEIILQQLRDMKVC